MRPLSRSITVNYTNIYTQSSPKGLRMLPTAFDTAKSTEVFDALARAANENNIAAPNKVECDAVFGSSPFLASLALRYTQETLYYLSTDPTDAFNQLLAVLSAYNIENEDDADFMIFLREQKNKAALLIACADILQKWNLEETTTALSALADHAITLATNKALLKYIQRGDIKPLSSEKHNQTTGARSLGTDCGYFILGMGKLGGRELNYSSDIDLIALYDPQRVEYMGRKTLADCFIRVTQDIVRFIDQRTMHGYVFRVDLRLRPDPGATPIAISVGAAASYYHSAAVNWERAAMIKARFVGGDEWAAQQFLAEMSAWVWRRNMDFEALKDIAAIKNQINRHYDTENEVFRGFDVKLGIGGIREIEFFVQVNQLLHAGRHPSLRTKSTLAGLAVLVDLEIITEKTANDLSVAYKYFRTLEHRIQMLHDEQTHSIPNEDRRVARLTTFMGYDTEQAFEKELQQHTTTVSTVYDGLLPDDASDNTALSDAALTSLLEEAGFSDIETAVSTIKTWQSGRYRSVRNARARDLLMDCMPVLISNLSSAGSPDHALIRFDNFLSQLPAGVQLFSLLKSNPALFGLLGRVMGLAPALATTLAKSPGLWDAVLDSAFFAPITMGDDMQQDLIQQFGAARDYQDTLDIARRFVSEQKFRAGVQLLEGIADAQEIGRGLSLVADYALQNLIPYVEKDFAEKHGDFGEDHSGIAVIALGKYGGLEMTHTSDIDVIFVYDTSSSDTFSNGTKPLMPNVYYARLAQHIVTAISALTPEGRLFEIDTRLRPSGNQGPLAITVSTLEEYYQTSAWTWEFLALTRARIVYGMQGISGAITPVILNTITNKHSGKDLRANTMEMRQKLRDQFDTGNPLEVKHTKGGMVDIEFICQFLILQNSDQYPEIIKGNTLECLKALDYADLLDTETAQFLASSYKLQQHIQSTLRLCLESTPKSLEDIPGGLVDMLITKNPTSDIDGFIEELKIIQKKTYAQYELLVENNRL